MSATALILILVLSPALAIILIELFKDNNDPLRHFPARAGEREKNKKA